MSATIPEDILEKGVKQVDFDEDTKLSIYHYSKKTTTTPSSSESVDDDDDDSSLCGYRGTVVDEHGAIVMRCFPYTEEYVAKPSTALDVVELSLGDWLVSPSIEGTLLRVFYYKDRWFLSTFRKLDAFKSRWGYRKSFGELFCEALGFETSSPSLPKEESYRAFLKELFDRELDRELQYKFLLESNRFTRIVIRPPSTEGQEDRCRVFFVGHMKGSKFYPVMESDEGYGLWLKGLPRPELIASFGDRNCVSDYVLNEVDPARYQGLMFYHKQENRQVRIVHPEYQRQASLRGNYSHLIIRYLQLRSQALLKNPQDVAQFTEFKTLFNDFSPQFEKYENHIQRLAKDLHYIAEKNFLQNYHIQTPPEEFTVIKKAFQKSTLQNPVSVAMVLDVLNQEAPFRLYQMIQRFFQKLHRRYLQKQQQMRHNSIEKENPQGWNHVNVRRGTKAGRYRIEDDIL